MKTKTIGSTLYFVMKYHRGITGNLECEISTWSIKKYAFKERDRWNEIYGPKMAFVFKGKQCIEVED